MRVQRVQLFFQPPGFIQDFRFAESEIPALRVPDVCDEPHVFRRLFGRYFCQIFDLRAFRPVLVQLIHFSFCVSLRAWKWPFSRAVLFSWPVVLFRRLSVPISGFSVLFPADCVRNPRNFVRFRPGNGRIAYTLSNLPCARGNTGKQALRQQRFGPLFKFHNFGFFVKPSGRVHRFFPGRKNRFVLLG